MKKSFIIVSIILSLIILGCTIPLETSREIKQDTRSTPEQSGSGSDDEEKEKLKEKIAELEKEKLEEKIEELEKKVEDQKKQTSSKTTTTRTKSKTQRPPKGYVRVNSPGDGWLALRTEPSTKTGRRILKIPHGTLLTLSACTGVRTSGRLRARWCRTSYRGYEGWIFDYYVIR